MFNKGNENGYKEILAGIKIKTLGYGDKTLLSEFHLEKGSRLPLHAHPQEQTGYLISGCVRLSIGGEVFEVRPGDSWCIPGGSEHGADILEDSKIIEVFSPIREDYLTYYSS